MISIYIVRGEGFPDSISKSNVYVAVEYSSSLGAFLELGQTQIIKKSPCPIWDNDCRIPFTPPITSTKNSEIIFKIYDHKDKKDDLIGKASFTFSSSNENFIGRLIPLTFTCLNSKNNHNASLIIKIQSNFSQLTEIVPFRFEKHANIYCYYSYPESQKNAIRADLSFLIISKTDPSFSKNFKEYNVNDISLNMEPIFEKPTTTGKSLLLNFDLSRSAEIDKYIFVPILASNGYKGEIILNFAFISTSKNNDIEKPQLGARYKINVKKERMLSFPIALDFDKETKEPNFYHFATVNYDDINNSEQFISRITNDALFMVLKEQGSIVQNKSLSINEIADFFKIDYPKIISISLSLNQDTEHAISASAYTEEFALIGRISTVSNHNDIENAIYYLQNNASDSNFNKNKLYINLKLLEGNLKNVKFILIIVTSPSYENLKGKRPIIDIDDAESFSHILSFQPEVEEFQPAWLPVVLCRNKKGTFDVVTISKFFRSPKPFEAQILMKNYLKENNIMQNYLD